MRGWFERRLRALNERSPNPVAAWASRSLYALAVVLGLVVFYRGATQHAAAVNRNGGKDQAAYLLLGKRIDQRRAISLDGARPPAYPALLALIRDAGVTKKRNFTHARQLTIVWTLVAWFAFLFVLRRRLKPYTALTAWLALGFTLWMFYAPYAKAEALFYFFATGSFLLMLDMLWRPSFGRALATGVVTGIGYLFKASLSPALALFAGIQLLAALVEFLRARPAGRRFRRPLRRALSVPFVVGSFLLTVSPYLIANKAMFGHYFYNVNSDFYIWYDSWGESGRGTRGHGDRKGFPALPPSEIPSASRYFKMHGVPHALRRIERGAVGLAHGAATSYGFLPITLMSLASGAIALVTRSSLRRWLRRRWPLPLFCAAYFGGYFLSCTWFYAIHPGLRFLAALVPPLVFVGAWLADRGKDRGRLRARAVFPLLVGGALLIEAPTIAHWVSTLGMAGW